MSSYKCFLEKLEDEWDKEITLKRNDFLINKGDLNTNLYLVKEGSLRVFIERMIMKNIPLDLDIKNL
ncbi:hypothetical protein [Tenacibaculum finnmarkense]|uniref:hypothetical protein n=1 Tax=Tenacibaculum finnmarkense TaxID=2781243 RepID=UPI00350F9FF2